MQIVWRDDQFLTEREAAPSLQDRGYLLGDGIYGTLRIQGGKVLQWNAHWNRFIHSAQAFYLDVPFAQEQMHAVALELLHRNQMQEAVLRFTLTRIGGRGMVLPEPNRTSLLVTLFPLPPPSSNTLSITSEGMLRSTGGDEWSHKALHQGSAIRRLAQARMNGFDDLAWKNKVGQFLECSSSNLFFLKDGELFTHPLDGNILPGTYRAHLLANQKRLGILIHEQPLSEKELSFCQGAFLCNTVRGVQWIHQLDHKIFQPDGVLVFLQEASEAITREI